MVTYIKKNIKGYYVTLETELDSKLYSDIGTTWEDYINNKWIKLSDEQLAFKEANPTLSVKNVFNMIIPETPSEEKLLNIAINNKIQEIIEFDISEEVNSFYLNGVSVWFGKSDRVGLMNSINIEKSVGREESTMWFNGVAITINCDLAIQMLSQLELYALDCYNVTAQHKAAVLQLTNIDEVNNYDYSTGYPEKLSFEL